VLGVYLISRYVGCTLILDRGRDVVRFLLLGGPLSCLVNATISVTGLWLAGTISVHDFWFSWFTWWIGDAIGVMIVTPILLSLFLKTPEIWKTRRITVTVPLCFMLSLIISVYVFVSHREQQRIEGEFKLKSELVANQIKSEWVNHLDALYSEVAFFEASTQVDRDNFKVFAQYWLTRHRSIKALEWIPSVQDAERSDYEKAAQRDGYPNFKITERTQQGLMVERSTQSEYFPVYYVEPYDGNEQALGFDLSSNMDRKAAMDRALMTGKPAGTSRITLVQEKSDQYGILVLMPIYDRIKIPRPSEQTSRDTLKGFALGVFRIGDTMQVVLDQAKKQDIHVQLIDLTARQGEQFLYDSVSTTPSRNHSKTASQNVPSITSWMVTNLEIAGRHWQISFSPTAGYLAKNRSFQAWIVFAGRLVFVTVAVAFLLAMTGRTARVEMLVSERTKELEIEIAERRQIENALRESEDKYRRLIETTGTGYVILDDQGHVLDANREYAQLAGWQEVEDILGHNVLEWTARHDLKRNASEVRKCIDQGFVRNLEIDYITPSGQFTPIEINATVLHSSGTLRIVSLCRDITVRKQTDNELSHSFSLVQAALEATADGLLIVDQNGKIAGHNNQFADMWRIPEEILESKDDELVLNFVRDQLKKPDEFFNLIKTLYGQPNSEHFDILEFKDERIFERYTRPQVVGGVAVGRVWSFRDITERKRWEETLRESEGKYRHLFESLIDVYYRIDSEGKFVMVSPSFTKTFGYQIEEILGTNVRDLYVHPEERDRIIGVLLRSRVVDNFEVQLKRKGGSPLWVSLNARIDWNPKGKFLGVEGLARDITERKLSEEALQQSHDELERRVLERTTDLLAANENLRHEMEERLLAEEALSSSERKFRTLAENTPDTIARFDKDCRRIYVNPACERLFGIDSVEVLGRKPSDLSPLLDAVFIEQKLQEVLEDGQVFQSEIQFRSADGELRWGLLSIVPEFDSDGQVVSVLAVGRDINALKEAQKSLNASEKQFRSLMETSPGVMYFFLLKPDGTVSMPYVSPRIQELNGLTPEDMAQDMAKAMSRIHPEDLDIVSTSVEKSARRLSPWRTEFRWLHPTKGEVWVAGHSTPERQNNGDILWSGFFHDITEQKNLEKELFAAKKMEIIGQLAGGVAHEVRNPLNAILSISEALFKEKEIAENPQYQPYIDHIRAQVNRLSKLMTDLLGLGKPITPANIRPVSLDHLCADTISLWKVTEAAKEHSIHYFCDFINSNLWVRADYMRLQQAILNLLDNAAYCSPKGKEILLRIVETGEGTIAVQVIDSGKGVAPEKLDRVFEPFFSLRTRGTGLGLTLVKHFVESMSGKIQLRNNVASPGCTAELVLNIARKNDFEDETKDTPDR